MADNFDRLAHLLAELEQKKEGILRARRWTLLSCACWLVAVLVLWMLQPPLSVGGLLRYSVGLFISSALCASLLCASFWYAWERRVRSIERFLDEHVPELDAYGKGESGQLAEWTFRVDEVSMGVYVVIGTDQFGRDRIQLKGQDQAALLDKCKKAAARMLEKAGLSHSNSLKKKKP